MEVPPFQAESVSPDHSPEISRFPSTVIKKRDSFSEFQCSYQRRPASSGGSSLADQTWNAVQRRTFQRAFLFRFRNRGSQKLVLTSRVEPDSSVAARLHGLKVRRPLCL